VTALRSGRDAPSSTLEKGAAQAAPFSHGGGQATRAGARDKPAGAQASHRRHASCLSNVIVE
jgi:hypothetical protein